MMAHQTEKRGRPYMEIDTSALDWQKETVIIHLVQLALL